MPKINKYRIITFGVFITAAMRPFFLGSIFALLSILLTTFCGSSNIDAIKSVAMTPETTRILTNLGLLGVVITFYAIVKLQLSNGDIDYIKKKGGWYCIVKERAESSC